MIDNLDICRGRTIRRRFFGFRSGGATSCFNVALIVRLGAEHGELHCQTVVEQID